MEAAADSIWIDGKPGNSLSLPDRGLDFGDGLFETFLLHRGRPLFTDLHFERLALGVARLGFPAHATALSDGHLRAVVSEYGHASEWAALRLTLTRGLAPRGYAPPTEPQLRVIIRVTTIERSPLQFQPVSRLGLSSLRLAAQPLLAGIKHLNRLEQVLVAMEARKSGFEDMVALDCDGQVCSTSSANIFLVEEGRIVTPSLERCGINGTRRRLLMERLAPALGLEVEEGEVSPERLRAAEEIFCTNSLRGLQPVGEYAGRNWREHRVCRALHQKYIEALGC